MSTIQRPPTKTLPPLVAGEHLDQPTFHERYEAMPPETRAELIGGVVFVTPPHRASYGRMGMHFTGWHSWYEMKTAGLEGANHCTIKIDVHCEVEPECSLRIPEPLGGKCWIDAEGYLCGAPEMVVEIDDHSRDLDLGLKKSEYERVGILEYLFVGLDPEGIHWFIRRGNRFDDLPAGPDGIYRSEVFPGLWLDPVALISADRGGLVQVLDQGLATPEHRAFVAKLAKARRQPEGQT